MKRQKYGKIETQIEEFMSILHYIIGFIAGLVYSYFPYTECRLMGESVLYSLGTAIVLLLIVMSIVAYFARFAVKILSPIIIILVSAVFGIFIFADKKSKIINIKNHQSEFDDIHKKYIKIFEDISVNRNEKSKHFGVPYLQMDNESKYELYISKPTEQLVEKTDMKVKALRSLIANQLEPKLYNYTNEISRNKDEILETYKFGEIKELLNFSKKLSVDYNETYEAYMSDKIAISIGTRGEESVNDNLKMYDHKLTNLKNMRFEVDDVSIETDNLVLSPTGVFSLEVKNLGSTGKYDIRIEKDGKWTKLQKSEHSNKVFESSMSNITDQTYRHVALTEKMLNKELKKLGITDTIDVQPLIVFANDKVNLENNSDMPIVRISNIYREINKGTSNISQETLLAIKNICLKNTLPAKKYEAIDIVTKAQFINNYCEKIMPVAENYLSLIEKMIE